MYFCESVLVDFVVLADFHYLLLILGWPSGALGTSKAHNALLWSAHSILWQTPTECGINLPLYKSNRT